MNTIPQSSLQWLAMQEEDWARRQRNELPPIINMEDFLAMDFPIPQWQVIDLEDQYRKGFYHGIVEAIDLIYRLKKFGHYERPQEIANMLSNWCNELRRWRESIWHEDEIQNMTTPTFKWESWKKMKEKCHERDGWACTDCGATEELEAHHIESVRDGGTPELDNLLTLCKTCHRGSTHH